MQTWLNYFERNRKQRQPIPWENGIQIEPHLRGPLIRSLQKFQIGESGEGRKLRRHAAATKDETYAAAINLFIKEEQEHARLMAEILKRLDAPLLQSHWSDRCFVWLRHLFGLHQELLVLLLPEMIAKVYFRALRDGTLDPVLRAVTAQIEHDENGHLAFHVEYLHRAFERLSFTQRIAAQIGWRIIYRATCLVVMFDHRDLLRAAGVRRPDFWRDCGVVFDEVAAGIFHPNCVFLPNLINQVR
jgi:hypothetical protein